MQKVHVGGSIAHAYEFLFGRFFQIIGTAWLPALLYGLGSYVYLLNMQPWTPMHAMDGGTAAKTAVVAIASIVGALIIRSVIGISLTQEAFGVRKDLTLAHFVVGPRELRLFFAQLRLLVVFVIAYAAAVLALCVGALYAAKHYGAGLAPNLALKGTPIATVAAGLFAAILAVWFVLAMLRLAFILPAVASVEHRTRLARAWSITGGNGWRILIVCVVTFLPMALVAGAAMYFLLGPNDVTALIDAIVKAKPGNPPPVAQFYSAHALALSVFGAVLTVINGALLAGASAAAYRAVTGHEEPELEDDAVLVAPLIAPAHGEEPLPAVPGHDSHGGHDDHGHGGHDDHGHGDGHDDGHGHKDHGHDDHGHGGGHDDHGNGSDHGGHGHDEAHGGNGDHGHGGHDDDGHGHGDHGHGGGHGDGHGNDDHGHGGHGQDDHGHGDGHHHHAKAA